MDREAGACMKAIILAAGRGSRMYEGTANMPKCMMKLCGKPLIDRGLASLQAAGFNRQDIGIVTGYKSETIRIDDVRYFHNAKWETTNMFFSLTFADEWLKKGKCIVCYSDITYHSSVIDKLMNDDHDIAITYYVDFWQLWSKRFGNPLDDLETFKIDCGKLVEIGGMPKSISDIHGQYMGLLSFTPIGWQKIKEAVKLPMKKPIEKLDMTTLLQHLLDIGQFINIIPTNELWLECDNLDDIRLYEQEYHEYL